MPTEREGDASTAPAEARIAPWVAALLLLVTLAVGLAPLLVH